jgi:ribosomal subunit interface protein
MDITINARHCKVPDSLRNQAQQRLDRLARLDRRLTAATLVFDVENTVKRVEARVAVAGGPPIIGAGNGATLRSAMDTSLDRLERQLKSRRKRILTRRTRAVPATVSVREDMLAEL